MPQVKLPAGKEHPNDVIKALQILTANSEKPHKHLTRLSKRILDDPITLVSFIDKEEIKFKTPDHQESSEVPHDTHFFGSMRLKSQYDL